MVSVSVASASAARALAAPRVTSDEPRGGCASRARPGTRCSAARARWRLSPPPSASHGRETRHESHAAERPNDPARHGAELERSARSASRISHRTSSSLAARTSPPGRPRPTRWTSRGKTRLLETARRLPPVRKRTTGGPPGPGPRAGRDDPSSPSPVSLAPSSVSLAAPLFSCRPPPHPPVGAPLSMSAGESSAGRDPFASVRTSAPSRCGPAYATLRRTTHPAQAPRRQSVSARVGGVRRAAPPATADACFSAAATLGTDVRDAPPRGPSPSSARRGTSRRAGPTRPASSPAWTGPREPPRSRRTACARRNAGSAARPREDARTRGPTAERAAAVQRRRQRAELAPNRTQVRVACKAAGTRRASP